MLLEQAIPLSWKEQIIAVLKPICNSPIKVSLRNTHDGLETNTVQYPISLPTAPVNILQSGPVNLRHYIQYDSR